MPTTTDSSVDTGAHWVRIGVLTKAHGIKGELSIHLDNPDGDVLAEGLVVRLEIPARAPSGKGSAPKAPVEKTITRVFAGGMKLGLDGVDSRDAADALRGAIVSARREDFPEPEEDELYLVDFVGAVVVTMTGEPLGVVRDFSDNGAQPLALVEDARGHVTEMPFVPGLVVRIDEPTEAGGAKRVVVDPPEGLFSGEALVIARSDGDDDDDATDSDDGDAPAGDDDDGPRA
jgi:16S rRNA processing protein RimM